MNGQTGQLLPLDYRPLRVPQHTVVYSGSTVPLEQGKLLQPTHSPSPGTGGMFLARASSAREMTQPAVTLSSYSPPSLISLDNLTLVFEKKSGRL